MKTPSPILDRLDAQLEKAVELKLIFGKQVLPSHDGETVVLVWFHNLTDDSKIDKIKEMLVTHYKTTVNEHYSVGMRAFVIRIPETVEYIEERHRYKTVYTHCDGVPPIRLPF